ncbi:MAG TPA: serine protease [Trebonia sp.]|nr:serine protease [Trebonia sp.]
MSQQLYPEVDAWVAAIHMTSDDFEPLGSGIVIDDNRVLTCAHVIDGTTQPWVSFPHAPGEARLPVDRVVLPASPTPGQDQDLAILVLAGPVPERVTHAPLRCPEPKSLIARHWWAFGFSRADPVGSSASGTIESTGTPGWIRLTTTSRFPVGPGFSGGGLWSADYQAVVAIVSPAGAAQGDGRAITVHQAIQSFPGQGLRALAEQSRASDSGQQALAAWGVNQRPGDFVYVSEGDMMIAASPSKPENTQPENTQPENAQPSSIGWLLPTDPETRRHWRPRARAVTTGPERVYRFRGHTAALTAIKNWLDRENLDRESLDRNTLIVTGAPGSGKSAVLGRIVTTADRDAVAELPADDDAVRATIGSVACAVYAQGCTSLEIAKQIARAASAAIPDRIEDLPHALREALAERDSPRFNVVIDALDATGDLLAAFGGAVTVIDLDAEEYLKPER